MKKSKTLFTLILCVVMCISSISVFAEKLVTLYTEDGRSKPFPESQVEAQLTVGWYREPVQRLYAVNKSKVFKKSEVAAQLTVGWYTYPVTKLYALDGREKVFATSQVAAQRTVGWYTLNEYVLAHADYLRDTSGYAAATYWLEEILSTYNKYNDTVMAGKVKSKLDTFCLNWYAKNTWIPLAIAESYITKNSMDVPRANLIVRNLSKKTIDTLEIQFTCYDASGNPTDDYQTLDRTVIEAKYPSHLSNIDPSMSYVLYIDLYSNTKTTKIGNFKIKKITFTDGSTWSR